MIFNRKAPARRGKIAPVWNRAEAGHNLRPIAIGLFDQEIRRKPDEPSVLFNL